MAATVNHVPIAARRSSALSMRTTSQLLRELSDRWPMLLIGHCRVCCAMTGRGKARGTESKRRGS